MNTWHIHIGGLVQGVGFRPFVDRLAGEMGINGWVLNSRDGVHIEFNASEQQAIELYHRIRSAPPRTSVITHHEMWKTRPQEFNDFQILRSEDAGQADILLPPDVAICDRCRHELGDPANRRYRYPFITCVECGPRYSILEELPFDRRHTTMANFEPCRNCSAEYHNRSDLRHHSQTNSCSDCAIQMHLYQATAQESDTDPQKILAAINNALSNGRIVAVKGIGGYLLLCDATDATAIRTLRRRKHRYSKPLALLYADMNMVTADAEPSPHEEQALQSPVAPIVLLSPKPQPAHALPLDDIVPGLDRIGVMLPCSPLLLLIAQAFGRPLVATSANNSGQPILYKDEDARNQLLNIADFLLTFDRDIVTPEDDSLMAFTAAGMPVLLRRSRGLAPGYYPLPDVFRRVSGDTVLAMGADLKSAFALWHGNNGYISQYLGDQQSIEAQEAFRETLFRLLKIVGAAPAQLLVDAHPAYHVSNLARIIGKNRSIPITAIQHHAAHFAAVLAENHLLDTDSPDTDQPVLGFIWDGTGYGDDGNIWGGEVFLFSDGNLSRVGFLDYFPHLLGDKMSREPRLAALSLLEALPGQQHRMAQHFSTVEWSYYTGLLRQPQRLVTSSMGRLLDGIAAILGITQFNNYEGEAAMRMEALARTATPKPIGAYSLPLCGDRLDWRPLLAGVLEDQDKGMNTGAIAYKVFRTLALAIIGVSESLAIPRMAFSGGVFQNTLLIDLVVATGSDRQLYFHRRLSPNDECIGFGQLAWYCLQGHFKHKSESYVSGHTW